MRMLACLLALLAVAAPALPERKEEPPLGVEDFLATAVFREVAVSPDGRFVALVVASDDFAQDRQDVAVWRVEVGADGRALPPVRWTPAGMEPFFVRWSPDGRRLAFLAIGPSPGPPQLFVVEVGGGEPRPLTEPGRFSQGVSASDWTPDAGALVVAAPAAGAESPYGDVLRLPAPAPRTTFYRIPAAGSGPPPQPFASVAGFARDVVVAPDGRSVGFLTGPTLEPTEFYDSFATDELFLLPASGEGPARQVTRNLVIEGRIEWARGGGGWIAAGLGEPGAPRSLWTAGRLYRIAGLDGRVETLARGFAGSFGELFQMPDGALVAAAQVSTGSGLYRIDPGSGQVRELAAFRGLVSRLSASRDGRRIAFVLSDGRRFPELYLADGLDGLAAARAATRLNAALDRKPMPDVETVSWPSEGETIEGVLRWPPGRRGDRRLPLVVSLHGGPWLAASEAAVGDTPDSSYAQLLAAHGYLVLEPNYRGSLGRGDAFSRAIEGFSCSRPTADVLAGVDFLVGRGWADPARVGLVGHSFGATLANCLIGRSGRFRAACSSAGIWNDLSYFGTADNFVQSDIRFLGKAPWEAFPEYWRESAIRGASEVRTPTLITIGEADRRTPPSQAYEMYRALVRRGVEVELLVFPGEGHFLLRPSHRKAKLQAELAWLDRHLRSEPVSSE